MMFAYAFIMYNREALIGILYMIDRICCGIHGA